MNYNNNNYPNYNPQLAPQTPPPEGEPEYFQDINLQTQNTAPQYNQPPGAPLYQTPQYAHPQPYNYQQPYIPPRKNNTALIVILLVLAAIVIVITGIISFISKVSQSDYYYEEPYNVYENYNGEYGNRMQVTYGEVFEFDGFEISIDDEYSFTYVDNEYSDFYMQDLVRVPVTIKNVSGSTKAFQSYNIKVFLSSGVESDDYAGYFFDDSIDISKEMRSGASMEVFLYFLYDGDGDYYIVFDDYSSEGYELYLYVEQ